MIKFGSSSGFYNQSLYKHGWSLFKQGENERSLDSFASVLDSVLVSKSNPKALIELETLSKPNRELVEDTFRVMSITFSYQDGAKTIDEFVKHRKQQRPYYYLLYARLGDLYMEKERYTDAADVYRAFVSQDRNNEKAPLLEMQAIEAYSKGGFPDLVLQGKKEFVENYSYGTAFWQGRTPKDEPKVVAVLKINLKDVAQYYHAQAQRTKNVADFQEAAKWYRSYLTSFPDDPESAVTNYLLADTLFESKQYLDAAQQYENTAYSYGSHAKAADAGYAALVAYGKEEDELSGEAKAKMHSREVDSSLQVRAGIPDPSGERAGAHSRRNGSVRGEGLSTRHCRCADAARPSAAGGRREAAHRLHRDRKRELRAGTFRQGGGGLRERAGAHAGQRSRAGGDRRSARGLDLQAGRAEEPVRRQRRRGGGFPARVEGGAQLQGARERGFRRRRVAHHSETVGSSHRGARGLSAQLPAKPAAARRDAQARRGVLGIQPSGTGRGRIRADRPDSDRERGPAAGSDAAGRGAL